MIIISKRNIIIMCFIIVIVIIIVSIIMCYYSYSDYYSYYIHVHIYIIQYIIYIYNIYIYIYIYSRLERETRPFSGPGGARARFPAKKNTEARRKADFNKHTGARVFWSIAGPSNGWS